MTLHLFVGTKRQKYLDDNWGCLKVGLSPVELEELRSIISQIPIEGAQY